LGDRIAQQRFRGTLTAGLVFFVCGGPGFNTFSWRGQPPPPLRFLPSVRGPEGTSPIDTCGHSQEMSVPDWAQNDPAGAEKFLESLSPGRSRESAVQTCISQLSLQSPEFAAPFANQIDDEDQRFNSAQAASRSYQRNDSAGYAKCVATLNLSEEKLKFLPK
jgi:hypothetical protein